MLETSTLWNIFCKCFFWNEHEFFEELKSKLTGKAELLTEDEAAEFMEMDKNLEDMPDDELFIEAEETTSKNKKKK